MKQAVVLDDLLDLLPFDALSWEKYQSLCTDVLYKQHNIIESREYLNGGNKQDGIDIYACVGSTSKKIVAQCKKKEYVSPSQVNDIIDEFLKNKFANETMEFILCTSFDLSRQRDEEETIENARRKLSHANVNFIVWDARGLSTLLRTTANNDIVHIVSRYFGEEIAIRFFGEVWRSYISRLQRIPKQHYKATIDFIQRTLSNEIDSAFNKRRSYWDLSSNGDITTVSLLGDDNLNGGKQLLILSTAGYGKTEELNNVAAYFSKEDRKLHPIKYILQDYEGQGIDELLHLYNSDWQNINSSDILLIFDGLDEIQDNHFQKFINSINGFIVLHPNVNVIISSRFNFYDLKSKPLRDFKIYTLNPLTNQDIDTYVLERAGEQKALFFELMAEKGFKEYIDNPFYLTRLVRFFIQNNGCIPDNKTQLFEKIIFEQTEIDDAKYQQKKLKASLMPIAQKVAVVMTLTGKSNLKDSELFEVIPDSGIIEQLKHLCIINRNSSVNGAWSFEHKNLQEYLCATFFAQQTFDKLHPIISFEFNKNKLIPKFLNSVSFLFEIIDKDCKLFKELFEWLQQTEPELFIRFEKEQLSKQTRTKIFESIFDTYKHRGLTFRISSNFSLEELAFFVDIDKQILDFIEQQLLSQIDSAVASDAIWLVSFCRRPYIYRNQIERMLLSVLSNGNYLPFVHVSCIAVLRELNFVDKALFETVLCSGIDLWNYKVRQALISYLCKSDFYEEYSQFLIDSISLQDPENENTIVIKDDLKSILLKLSSPVSVKRLLQYVTQHADTFSRYRNVSKGIHFELADIKMLIEKANVIYQVDKTMLRVVYRIFIQLEHVSLYNEWVDVFKDFFMSTCGINRIFYVLYKHHKKQSELMLFADNSCCDFLVQEYVDGKLSEEDVKRMRNVLSYTDYKLSIEYLTPKLNSVSKGKFAIDIDTNDYVALQEIYLNKNQEILKSHRLFLEEANNIFMDAGKDSLTMDDLWAGELPALRRYRYSIVLETMKNFNVKNKGLKKEKFINYYSSETNWGNLSIDKTVELLNEKKTVDSALIDKLRAYCIQKIETLDFINSIKDTSPTSWSYTPIVEFLKSIVILLELNLEDALLVKMLPSFYESAWQDDKLTIGEYIVKNVKDRKLLKSSILGNISNHSLARIVLISHYSICKNEKYVECLPYLYNTITSDERMDAYDKNKLAEYYVDLGGLSEDFLEEYYKLINSNKSCLNSWDWYIVKNFREKHPNDVTEFLLNIMTYSTDIDSKATACKQLIQMNNIKGLEYFTQYIVEFQAPPFELYTSSISQHIVSMPSIESLPLLIAVLEYIYTNNLNDLLSPSKSINDTIYASLIAIACLGMEEYEKIKQELERIANDSRLSSKSTFSINANLEHLTKQFYEKVMGDVSIHDACCLHDSLSK